LYISIIKATMSSSPAGIVFHILVYVVHMSVCEEVLVKFQTSLSLQFRNNIWESYLFVSLV